MKFVFAGGGTMGHVSPSLAIAKEHERRHKGATSIFIGREGGSENMAIQRAAYPLYTLSVSGLIGKKPMQILSSFHSVALAMKQATQILKKEKPACVIGTGGYVCYPVLSAAVRLGIPTVLHESNVIPGVATRMLMASVDLVLLGMEGNAQAFKKAKKAIFVGIPTDRAFYTTSSERARARLGIGGGRLILSFGGSLGAEAINRFVSEAAVHICRDGVTWIHASGRRYYDAMREHHPDTRFFRLLPYIEDMPSYLAAADLVICRSGASTVAELLATKTPAILIPSPNVAGNHQEHNARMLEERGGGILLDEREIGTPHGLEMLKRYLESLPEKKEKPKVTTPPQVRALEEIYAMIEEKTRGIPDKKNEKSESV